MAKKKKKEFYDEMEDLMEIDEDSDHPIHEKFVKPKKIKRIK